MARDTEDRVRTMKYDIQKLFNCHSVITGLSGRLGHYVFYMRNDTICARRYIVPPNPRTARQQARRTQFAGAVRRWRNLDEAARASWNVRAGKTGRTGYNLFISEQMRDVDVAAFNDTGQLKPAPRIIHVALPAEPMPPHTASRPGDTTGLAVLYAHVTSRSRDPAEIRAA
jgi:hypothetical protein